MNFALALSGNTTTCFNYNHINNKLFLIIIITIGSLRAYLSRYGYLQHKYVNYPVHALMAYVPFNIRLSYGRHYSLFRSEEVLNSLF